MNVDKIALVTDALFQIYVWLIRVLIIGFALSWLIPAMKKGNGLNHEQRVEAALTFLLITTAIILMKL